MSAPVNISNINVRRGPTTKLRSSYLDENMDTMWNRFIIDAKESGRKVWNSTLYRMESFSFEEAKLDITLSTIEVKEIQMSMKVEGEYDLGERFRPYNIFVCSLLETADGKFIFGKTNTNTLNAGRVDLIGGALSHTESEVHTGRDIYRAALREIHEELNIDDKHIRRGNLCCLLRTNRFNVGVVFHVTLGIDSSDVSRIFSTRNNDEIVELVQIERSELPVFLRNSKSYMPLLADVVGGLTYTTDHCV